MLPQPLQWRRLRYNVGTRLLLQAGRQVYLDRLELESPGRRFDLGFDGRRSTYAGSCSSSSTSRNERKSPSSSRRSVPGDEEEKSPPTPPRSLSLALSRSSARQSPGTAAHALLGSYVFLSRLSRVPSSSYSLLYSLSFPRPPHLHLNLAARTHATFE